MDITEVKNELIRDAKILQDVIQDVQDVEVLGCKIKFKIEEREFLLYCYNCDHHTDYVLRTSEGNQINFEPEEYKKIQESLKIILNL